MTWSAFGFSGAEGGAVAEPENGDALDILPGHFEDLSCWKKSFMNLLARISGGNLERHDDKRPIKTGKGICDQTQIRNCCLEYFKVRHTGRELTTVEGLGKLND
jgi:hypothetical protein